MKVQEVIMRAMAKKISWSQAAEIVGISGRSIRRWRERYEAHGYDGLTDRGRGRPSGRPVPLAQVERVPGAVSGEVLRSERPPFSREASQTHLLLSCF